MSTDHTPFWRSLPGVLTGIAAVVVAATGLLAVIAGAGPRPRADPSPSPSATSIGSSRPASQAPSTPTQSASASGRSVFGKNLVTNGDAERGCSGHQAGQPVAGWTAPRDSALFTIE